MVPVVVLGAGEMGEGMAVSLAGAGVDEMVVVNRTFEHGAELAARVQGRAARLAELTDELVAADVLLTSTGATSMIVESADIAAVMQARAGRPLLIVDIALPRDVDPAAASVSDVTKEILYSSGVWADIYYMTQRTPHTPQVLETIGLAMYRTGHVLSYRGQCRVVRLANAGRILRPAK